jgi:hypothetical protein
MTEEFPELERLAELSRRFPQLARAITAETPAIIAADVKPTPQDLRFLTRVTASPMQVEGYLGCDSVWRITAYHIAVDARWEAQIEAAIAEQAEDEYFIVIDGVGETVVKWCIRRFLATTPPGDERTCFEKRLAESRFAPDLTFH